MSTPVYTLDIHFVRYMTINWVKTLNSLKCFSVGEAYSVNWRGEWAYLYSLAKDQPNNGSFSFLPKPAENGFSSWELGSVRVSPSTYPDGTWYVQTLPMIYMTVTEKIIFAIQLWFHTDLNPPLVAKKRQSEKLICTINECKRS